MTQKFNEVSPPGWGHTKAEKEKTKPEKPKSKIGGTAHAMKLAQKRGDIPKNMNIFALMWSMKNKGDKPHYKAGVKDVLKKKYKGPEGQNEEKADEKPYPPTRLFKNVPNSVVKKANKEADKVKKEQEKAVLGEPPKNGPSGDSMHSKDNVYEDEKVDMVSLVTQAINELTPEQKKKREIARNTSTLGKGRRVHGGRSIAHPKGELGSGRGKFTYERPPGAKRKPGREKIIATPVKKEGWGAVAKAADSSIAAEKKKKETSANKKVSSWMKAKKEDVEVAEYIKTNGARRKTAGGDGRRTGNHVSITPAGKKALKKGDHKLSITPKGAAAIKDDYVSNFGDVLRQAIEEAKKVNAIDTINKIVKTKTMGKLHGQKVDLFTASAIQQVYNAINQKNQEKMEKVMSKDVHGLLKMADFSMKQMKR